MAAFSALSLDEEHLLSTAYKTSCLPLMNPELDRIESHQYYANQITHLPPNLPVSPSFCRLPSNASSSLPQYIDHYGTKTIESTECEYGGIKESPVSFSCEINSTNSSNGPLISDQGFDGSFSNEEEEKTRAKYRPHQMAPAKKNRKTSMTKYSPVESSKTGEAANNFVLVRARRGQATDRHSIAERVRREKIRKRMRSLQDLVPGCCKATGKTVILDEIINYIKSLQNQIEFLSMKLCAASPRYDFSLEAEKALEIRQSASTVKEDGKTDAMMEPQEGGKCTQFNSNLPSGSSMDTGCWNYVGETSALPRGGAEEPDVQLESFIQQLLSQQGPIN